MHTNVVVHVLSSNFLTKHFNYIYWTLILSHISKISNSAQMVFFASLIAHGFNQSKELKKNISSVYTASLENKLHY